MNIFVGNLSFKCEDQDLFDHFERYGSVYKANVITDRETGHSKGYGFVEMPDPVKAQEAISALNGTDFMGREIGVNEARPRSGNAPGGDRRYQDRPKTRR